MTFDTSEIDALSDDESAPKKLREHALYTRQLIENYGQAAFTRELAVPGHITASAIVLSPDLSSVLVIHHKKLLRWLQPGGHIEKEDASLLDAARREAYEETAVSTFKHLFLAWISIDIIPIWKGFPMHLHYDLKYAMKAMDWTVERTAETSAVAWVSVEELAKLDVTSDLTDGVARALIHFGKAT
jgi:8-oxo-dGTP pyrophosphatase MutT (NUDIX family)